MEKFITALKKNLAFTLAEVVIVMGIVGVIGVLMVANAKKDTDVAEKVAQLRKTNQILEAAFATAVMENGTIDTWGTDGARPTNAQIWDVIKNYLKFQKVCDTDSGCWKDGKPLMYSGGKESKYNFNSSDKFYKAILTNGVSLALNDECLAYLNNLNSCGARIIVDVNGLKGLNMYGNDIFVFMVDKEGSVVPALNHDATDKDMSISIGSYKDKEPPAAGAYTTEWVLKFGNMDYLNCAGSLSWTGKHTCK